MLFKKAKLKKFINKNKKINPYICIAGKNQCSIDCLKIVMKSFNKKQILVLPNNDDKGVDDWQPSLKKFANKNKIRVINIIAPIKKINNKLKKNRNIVGKSIKQPKIKCEIFNNFKRGKYLYV